MRYYSWQSAPGRSARPVQIHGHWRIEAPRNRFNRSTFRLKARPQGGARSRPRRLCSRDPQSFSGAPRSFRAWSCAEFRWARGAFNSVERLSLVREQVMNCLTATIFLGLPPAYCFTCGFALPAGVILHLYGRGLPTSCTFCDAVSRDDERFEPA